MTEEDRRNLQRYRIALRSASADRNVDLVACRVQIDTLARFLIRSGAIIESEWYAALADAAEREPGLAAPATKVFQESLEKSARGSTAQPTLSEIPTAQRSL